MLRLAFENTPGVAIDSAPVFRQIAEAHLKRFAPEWAGYIARPQSDLDAARMQPLWQMIIRSADPGVEGRLLAYLRDEPLPGYR